MLKTVVSPASGFNLGEDGAQETKEYERVKFRLKMISMAISFAYLLFLAFAGGLYIDSWVQPWAEGNRWLELLGVAVLCLVPQDIVMVPLKFYQDYVVEHRFGLSTQTIGGYIVKQLKLEAISILAISAFLSTLFK